MTTARELIRVGGRRNGRTFDALCQAVDFLLAREAEREATPPSAGDGDEPPVGTVLRDGIGMTWEHRPDGWHGGCSADCDEPPATWRVVKEAPPLTVMAEPPAPAQGEDAVEALELGTAILRSMLASTAPQNSGWLAQDITRAVRDALDRGAVPGYGPTGASDGAGEVDGVWTCGHCGRAGSAHAPGMPSADCVAEMVWKAVR